MAPVYQEPQLRLPPHELADPIPLPIHTPMQMVAAIHLHNKLLLLAVQFREDQEQLLQQVVTQKVVPVIQKLIQLLQLPVRLHIHGHLQPAEL